MEFVFEGLGISLSALVGIPATVLTVIVLLHPEIKSPLSSLLLGRTISDIFVLIPAFLLLGLPGILRQFDALPSYETNVLQPTYPWLYHVYYTAKLTSIFLTLVITWDRYTASEHPFRVGSIRNHTVAIRTLCLTVLVAILIHLPGWYFFRNRDWSLRIYNFVFVYIPVLTVIYFCYKIFKKKKPLPIGLQNSIPMESSFKFNSPSIMVEKSPAFSPATPEEENDRIRMSGMLMALVLAFLITHMKDPVKMLADLFDLHDQFEDAFRTILNFLVAFGHSSAFYFYCALSPKFRKCLRETLTRKKERDSNSRPNDNPPPIGNVTPRKRRDSRLDSAAGVVEGDLINCPEKFEIANNYLLFVRRMSNPNPVINPALFAGIDNSTYDGNNDSLEKINERKRNELNLVKIEEGCE